MQEDEINPTSPDSTEAEPTLDTPETPAEVPTEDEEHFDGEIIEGGA